MNNHNMEVLTNIIGAVESGGQVYGVRDYSAYADPYKNSPVEHTITLGWAQNYGDMAQRLIKMIFDNDSNSFKSIDVNGAVEQILNYNWVKIKWHPSNAEKNILIKLITSEVGKTCQDELFKIQMDEFVADCIKDYTSDPKAIVMYCEIRHLGGKGPVDRIFKRCYSVYSLNSILNSLKMDQNDSNQNLVGAKKFWSRHIKCSEFADMYIGEEDTMTENDIIICGHGSAKPSTKLLANYNTQRYSSLAPNGVHRGLVEVKRLISLTDSDRERFHDMYKKIIGRNIYSQDLREYCYKQYADGNYYSDCSSSGIHTFKQLGYAFPWTLNTAAIHTSNQFEVVPVNIVNGHIQNPEILKVGDCLLYAGNDPSRPLQIGHIEYVYEIAHSAYPKWIRSGDDWYYRLKEGVNAHGWLKIAETGHPDNIHWYYFDSKGKMVTEWVMIEGEWYYFQPNGSLQGALWHENDNRRGSLEIWYV